MRRRGETTVTNQTSNRVLLGSMNSTITDVENVGKQLTFGASESMCKAIPHKAIPAHAPYPLLDACSIDHEGIYSTDSLR